MNEKWFIRCPQNHINETYMRNMFGATQFFIRWFESDGDTVSFRNMLKHMHRIVSVDYEGHTNSNYVLKVSDGFRGDRGVTWHPTLKKQWFTGIGDEKNIRPVVPYMIPDMSHWLENTHEGYVLHLPDSKWVNSYLATMDILMQKMQVNISLDIRMLAAYIQLFVIGHPFEKINFSICMAQVNAILWLKGYEPIYHGWLDFECFMYDYKRIVEIFQATLSLQIS